MAIIHKIMKTFTRPDGNDKVQYEIVDDAGRKMIAPDWYEHEDEAFISGQHIVKDGILYRFLIPHMAETEWNSNEVTAVDVGEEIEAIVISLNGKIPTTAKGVANGVAELDSTGKVPAAQLPSYVDDVQEYSDKDHFPVTGSTGVIYVAIDTNKTYRWSGSAYVEISESLALGETSSTAFRGDHGKTAYDHATDANRLTTAQAEGLYKVSVSDEGHVKSVTAVQKEDITNLGIPAQDTTYSPATQSSNGLMSSQDKTKLDGIDMSSKVNTSDFYATEMPVSETDSTKVATALSDVKSAIDGKADIIRDTVSNVPIASISDGASNLPLTALRFTVEPIQAGSGDPYPAGGGKNKFNITAETGTKNGTTFTINADGSVKISGTPSSNTTYILGSVVLPAGTYKVNGCDGGSTTTYRMACYNVTTDSTIASIYGGADTQFTLDSESEVRIYPVVLTGFDGNAVTIYPMIRLASITDGTYAPYSNIRPITGRTGAVVAQSGKNLFGGEPMANSMVSAINNSTYCEKGTDSNGDYVKLVGNNAISRVGVFPLMKFKENTQYTVILKAKKSNTSRASNLQFFYTDGTTSNINLSQESSVVADTVYENAVTSSSGKTIEAIKSVFASGTTYFYYGSCGIFEGVQTVDAYTAYTGSNHPMQFGSTVYGGQIDWVNGVMVVDRALATLGKSDVFSVVQASTGIWYARFYILPGCTFSTVTGKTNEVKSNMYTSAYGAGTDNAVRLINGYPYVYNSQLDTLAKAEEFYLNNPLQIWYPLAEPITVPLSDLDEIRTVEVVNNLWADCGDIVELTYGCDTKGYIDKKLAELTALILENS